MQISDDADHRAALNLALDMVLADLSDPNANLAHIMEPFIVSAATPRDAEVREGLVCRYLTKIGSQLAGVINSASNETFDLWVKEMRALAE